MSAEVRGKLLTKMNKPSARLYKDKISKLSSQNKLINFQILLKTQCYAVAGKQLLI